MAEAVNYPVQRCNSYSYRLANCYFCNQTTCALQGSLDSPVMACNQFAVLTA